MAVRYRSLADGDGIAFKWESSLNKILTAGNYAVEIEHYGADVGLPIEDCGTKHSIVGTLVVTDSGALDNKQGDRVMGQVLTFTQRESKETSIYTRTYAGGEWGEWCSLARTGMYDEITNADALYSTVTALASTTKELKENLPASIINYNEWKGRNAELSLPNVLADDEFVKMVKCGTILSFKNTSTTWKRFQYTAASTAASDIKSYSNWNELSGATYSIKLAVDASKVQISTTGENGGVKDILNIAAATTESAGVMSAEDKNLIINNLGVDGNLSDIAKRIDNVEELIGKPVTPNDTTFFKPSVNVVNWFELDVREWSLGSAATSTYYASTDFIRLKPNTKYTINQICRKIYTFRNSGEFEDSVTLGANPLVQDLENVSTFTTGEYDFYVRLMIPKLNYNIDTIMLVEGDSLPEEYVSPAPTIYPEYIPPVKEKKRITAIGSSGLALLSGGQWALSDEQKQNYNVTDDLTMARVLQVLLGYDETNIIAIGGNTASNSMFLCGLSAYRLKNSFTLYADASDTYYEWTTSTIEAQMTENLNTVGNIKSNGSFTGVVNGVEVYVYPNGSIIRPITAIESDVVIPEGSMLYRKPSILPDDKNGTKRDIIQESYGLLLQIGANDEGNTPEELLNYFDLAIKASGCKWFICLPKNGSGIHSTSELNNAIPLLKKKYGSRFIDHRPYMCSLQALIDQGITPTTSDTYPDKNGTNSNPLTETQIANGVPCDMQCISEGCYPSSFWHSAYRANEPNNQTINNTHFNAQGLEAWGKFLYKMVKTIYIE